MTDEIRNGSGNLVGYSGKNYEAMFVKLDGRIERIESNLGDARIEIQKSTADLEHIKNQVTGLCNLVQKYLAEIQTHINRQVELESRIYGEDGIVRCTEKIKRKLAAYDAGIKIGTWITTIIIALTGMAIGFFKNRGGQP